MRVHLDDHLLTESAETFAHAVALAASAAVGQGRLVIGAMVDGAAVDAEVLESPPARSLGAEARFRSIDRRELIANALVEASEVLRVASLDQSAAGELIQSARVADALPKLGSALSGWQAVKDTVQACVEALDLPRDRLAIARADGSGVETLADMASALAGRLAEVKRALGSDDWSVLADLLAYDMGEQADRWGALLDHLSTLAGRR
ncbi:MAG: hypothetical protein JNM80_13320 [Phycisphaerae bacterium]|nr:hypothetical protein [Phycisphaerae bacterium]